MGNTKPNEKKVKEHGNHKSTRRRKTRLRKQNERKAARIQPKQPQHRTTIQNRPSNRNTSAVLLRHRTERNNVQHRSDNENQNTADERPDIRATETPNRRIPRTDTTVYPSTTQQRAGNRHENAKRQTADDDAASKPAGYEER